MTLRTFASDNYSGVHPLIMEALAKCNPGHAPAYGADLYTREASDRFKEIFGPETEVFFVYNGTGANVLGLAALTQSFDAILCSDYAHIQVDESTAPEKFTGNKLIPLPSVHGKISPAVAEPYFLRRGVPHHAQPRVISISQLTEYGTAYTQAEIRGLADLVHQHQGFLHMDGARIANAAAGAGVSFAEFTVQAGVDVLSFGGTKNGMMFGEAILVFNPALAKTLPFQRKMGMQLHSKMRYIGAQFARYLQDDLWLTNARHANAMASELAKGLRALGIQLTQEVHGNVLFAIFPKEIIEAVQRKYFFYVWNEITAEVRMVCSFDTTPEDVAGILKAIEEALNRA